MASKAAQVTAVYVGTHRIAPAQCVPLPDAPFLVRLAQIFAGASAGVFMHGADSVAFPNPRSFRTAYSYDSPSNLDFS